MDAVSIRVPYKNLKKEVELVGVDEEQLRRLQIANRNRIDNINSNDSSPSSRVSISNGDGGNLHQEQHGSLFMLILSCTVAAGVQFGWALQLSLLTPYIQTLGIEHAFSSFIWLCGPITGLVVQPCVGIWSDKCTSKYGRRRPFIVTGALMISFAVILIGFSADIGYILGDTKEHCSTFKGTRTIAAIVFILGFWMLDLANNTVQGPARALLADLAGPDQRNSANAVFCSWMAVGNILGFSAGASGHWHRWFPFLLSRACCAPCGNLKAAFLVAVVFLTFCTLVTIYFAKEIPLISKHPHKLSDSAPLLDSPDRMSFDLSKSKADSEVDNKALEKKPEDDHLMDNNLRNEHTKVEEDASEHFSDSPGAVLVNLLTSLRHLPPAMHSVLIVMALTWVVLFVSSLLVEPMCRWIGPRLVWATSNFIVFACMVATAFISLVSSRGYSEDIQHVIGANAAAKTASLVVFALLGVPLAITYTVPFAVTAELTADSGGGQGLAIGVLNLAIVVPQMVVSLGAGPWDALFGGGNIPAFVLASIAALAAGVIAIFKLPDLSTSSYRSTGLHFG